MPNNKMSPGKYNMAKVAEDEPSMVSAYKYHSNGSAIMQESPPPYSEVVDLSKANGVKNEEEASSEEVEVKDGKKKKEEQPMVGMLEVFRFADLKSKVLLIVGIIASCVHGACLPLMIIVFGDMTDTFVSDGRFGQFWNEFGGNISSYYNVTEEQFLADPVLQREVFAALNMTDEYDRLLNDAVTGFLSEMNKTAIYYVILGCVVVVVGYCQISCMMTSAFRQTQTARISLFRAILRQDIGWFDTHEIGELNTRLSDDVNKIQDGLGDKFGQFFQYLCMFLAGIIVGLVYGWKLTLVIMAVSPLLAVAGGFMSTLGTAFTSKELKAYAKAGAVAEEVLSSIRTVLAFGGENKEAIRYAKNLVEAKNFGVRKGMINGGSMGLVFFIMFGSYALAFWYGNQLVMSKEYTAGDVLIVFFSVMIGAFSLGNTTTNFQYFATARGAAHAVYNIIDLVPSIDSASEDGLKPSEIVGNIEFSDVKFSYPSRPDVTILDSMNLKVDVGQTVALVGSSGCGKSTTIQLLQRFYDTLGGSVKVDGNDIRDLNVQWLRRHIGVVSQEPILFATTIAENIRYGREDVTDKEIEKAAVMANAHDFISKLPKKYETLVGERGAQMSGGQKQRIAIARALVRNPKILLLDEATSALDTESESVVQSALDKARQGRTTIIIAHRLSTIRTADVIAGFKDGRVIEQGTHEELMAIQGIYYTLVTTQTHVDDVDEDDEFYSGDLQKRKLSRAMSNTSGGRPDSGKALERALSNMSKTGEQEEVEEDLPEPAMSRIMKMNAPEWPYILLGAICSMINGCIQPAFAIIFANIIGVFSELDPVKQEQDALLYSMLFLAIGGIQGIGMFGMSFMFSYSGENLTMRLRDMVFRTLLRQEVGYFDDHKNNTGALTTRLATDASAVQGATGSRIGSVLSALASIIAGLTIGFYFSWKLALLLLGFAPFMVVAGYVQMNIMTGNTKNNKEAMENAGKVATESIVNIRTVAQLTKEHHFCMEYKRLTEIPYKKNLKNANLSGLAFGFSQALIFFAYAACFRFGAFLIETDGLPYADMFRVVSAILFSAMAVGQASSFAPDYGKAKTSAARIFFLLDRTPTIDSGSTLGEKPSQVTGEIEFKGVTFNYPTRPNVTVLQGLDLKVKNGMTVALVGSSGCGKSTSIQLLERYYDALQGQVTIDNRDVKTLNISWLRSQIGLVQQEPILFDCSIRDNIAYGDNNRDVPDSEIIAAAKDANIHTFIASLPQGYDTNVGDKGAQLSGGQKQRIAIARALVRNPKILLLDEATSALDTESEKIVQDALDRAQQGRTCVVIAHRLSTIHDADAIAVIHNGVVVELGTHNELMSMQGRYYKLNSMQARKSKAVE